MGSDQPEDEEESTSIKIDASMISEITITRTGVTAITAYADQASPADNEPSTLEPQLGVRGLVSPGPSGGSAPAPLTHAEVGSRRDSEADVEEEDERTTQNVDSQVHAAYERALRSAASAAPLTQLSPILLTPSEPINVEAARSAAAAAEARQRRPPAPIPAAGRPPEQDLDRESAVTARRVPEKVQSLGASEGAPPIADTEDYEEETKTDAVHSELVAASRARAETRPVPQMQMAQHPAMEPDETRTKKAPLTMMSAQAAFMMEDPPRREPLAVEVAVAAAVEPRSELDAQAGAGSTVRMFFNPTSGQVAAHPDSERRIAVAQYPMQPFGEQPTVQVLPVQQNPMVAPPVIVRNPASLDETHGPRRKSRRVMPLVLLFVIACAASGTAVLFRDQLGPWIDARLPAGWRSPSPSVEPPAPSPPDPSASAAAASAAPAASASPLPPPPATGTATGSASTSASSAALSASAAASASAQRNSKNKRVPPKK